MRKNGSKICKRYKTGYNAKDALSLDANYVRSNQSTQ